MSLSDPIPIKSPLSPFNLTDLGAQDTVNHRHPQGDLKLHEVLKSLTPLPKHTLLLGLCEDGLPLLMDLSNPAPGSVLILGDQARSNKNLLIAMLASVLFYDPRMDIQMDLVTPRPEAFADFSLLDGLVISSPFDNTFPELIWHLARGAYQQGNGGRGQVVRVLLIDDLEVALSQLDEIGLGELGWLVQNGPAARIWVMASFNTHQFKEVDDQIIKAFGARLVGSMPKSSMTEYLTALPLDEIVTLFPGSEYCTWISGAPVKFWLPEYDLTVGT
jgi:hypothetical protein